MRRPRGGRFLPPKDDNEPRINHRIRKSPVRLIGENGEQVGVVSIEEARERAESVSLDLVEVGPTSDPPVVKILDWGKAKFERDKKAKESKKKAATVEIKEVKYRPTIDPHDFGIKTTRAERFLQEGKKVKVTIFFRYRQLRRPELGFQILDNVAKSLSVIADIESRSGLEGRQMTMIVTPNPTKMAEAKAAAKAAAKLAKDAGAASVKAPVKPKPILPEIAKPEATEEAATKPEEAKSAATKPAAAKATAPKAEAPKAEAEGSEASVDEAAATEEAAKPAKKPAKPKAAKPVKAAKAAS